MQRKLLFVVFFSTFFSTFSFCQKSYSYVTDRKFTDPEELLGYNFRPNMKEVKDVGKVNIAPGAVAFGITQNNLYVEGEGIGGVYNLNNINPTEFGFKLLFMNARDATVQGHLKVIIGKNGFVQALIFLRSNKEKEVIYYLPELTKDMMEKERKYFTDKNELQFIHQDSIYGKTIRPFLLMHHTSKKQERVEMKDSCMISFREKITIIDKTKKKDKNGKDSLSTEKTDAKIDAKSTEKIAEKPIDKKNIKIIKEHFVRVRRIEKYPDGTMQDVDNEYVIKNATIKEDKNVDMEGDRFLLILETNKGEISIFLNGNKMVNTVEAFDKTYLSRGY
jgi:hypothetical protein